VAASGTWKRTALSVPGQSTVGYEYHANGQVNRVFQGSTDTTFSFDLLGRRTSQGRSYGIVTNIAYGLDGFPSVIDHLRNNIIFDRHSFGRDQVGNITRHTRNAEDTFRTVHDDLLPAARPVRRRSRPDRRTAQRAHGAPTAPNT
jgi:hypothetical protein